MERLTAEDRLMLWSDGSWPQDIGALAILDGRTLLEPDGRPDRDRAGGDREPAALAAEVPSSPV